MGSWFTVTPAYKIKREGEPVAFGDVATFASVRFSGAGLRASDSAFDMTVTGSHPYVVSTREVSSGCTSEVLYPVLCTVPEQWGCGPPTRPST